ncbi:putative nucleotide-binding alpha-beta plait domain superfamily, RNA-binding domain superfamily [Helianthus anomalus]
MAAGITKFYVANIPDGCRLWDLATLLSSFGDLAGSKRNKEGLKFGFVSFKGVKDWRELEVRLQGLKLGESKLIINRARFARENGQAEENLVPPASNRPSFPVDVGPNLHPRTDAFTSNGRSYSSVLMKNGVHRPPAVEAVDLPKDVIVHNVTSAFFDLQGRSFWVQALLSGGFLPNASF